MCLWQEGFLHRFTKYEVFFLELNDLAVDFMVWQQSFSVFKKYPCPHLLVKLHWQQWCLNMLWLAPLKQQKGLRLSKPLTLLCRVSSKTSSRWANNVLSCNYHCELVQLLDAIIELLVEYDFMFNLLWSLNLNHLYSTSSAFGKKASAKFTDNFQKVFWVTGEWNGASKEVISQDLRLQRVS